MKQKTNKIRKFSCTLCRRVKEYPKNASKSLVMLVCDECCQTKLKKELTDKDKAMLKEFAKSINVEDLKKLAKSNQFK